MEKVKISADVLTFDENAAVSIYGKTVMFVKRIPYVSKREFAIAYASEACILDSKLGYAYLDPEETKIMYYYVMSYYSNLDVDDMDIDDVFDIVYPYWDEIRDAIGRDMIETMNLADNFAASAIEVFNYEHSLVHKLAVSFAGILDGKDIVQEISQSKLLNEEMLNLLANQNGVISTNDKITAFSEFAKKTL